MADGTKIEWTEATANVINGCSLESPGCTNCYAMRLAGTRLRNHPTRAGLTQQTKAGPVWTGEVRFHEPALLQALRWQRPRMIFWNAHGDMFHPNVPDAWIDRCFAAMALTPQHIHQVLTKRSARMREYCDRKTSASGAGAVADAMAAIGGTPGQQLAFMERIADYSCLPNIWLGVSVEDQTRADERVPHLLATPAAIRFVSAEPLLGPIDFTRITHRDPAKFAWLSYAPRLNALTGNYPLLEETREPHPDRLDWVIVGGESGPGARPMHPDWARSLRDQCAAAGVPFFFKQWGEWAPCEGDMPVRVGELPMMRVGKKAAGRLIDGVEHNGMPAHA